MNVHYVNPEDHNAQDFLLCIQTNAGIDDEKRMRAGETILPATAGRDGRAFCRLSGGDQQHTQNCRSV